MKSVSRIFKFILSFVFISALVYFGISAVLILTGGPETPDPAQRGLTFDELFFDYKGLPELKTFTARDGARLGYRRYAAESDKILILLHGAAWHSRYFLNLAQYISAGGLAEVITPDLRGHGPEPARRGDVDYMDQLEDDLSDLIGAVRKDHPASMLIVGGHSSGGGLALRFAGSPYGNSADAYLLIAPFLKYNAPTTRQYSVGFAMPYTRRIIGLVMLNWLGIHWFDGLTAMAFNMPEKARDGTETLHYSHRLTSAYAPRNYEMDLTAITQPLLVIAGTKDEAFVYCEYEPVISRYTDVEVRLLQGVTHMGAVAGPEIRPVVKEWLQSLDASSQ